MTDLPDMKIKSIPSYPANILGGDGIEANKVNGHVVIDLAHGEFATQTSIPTSPTNTVLTYDTATGSYINIPSSLLGGAVAGISDAPVDGTLYGRQSAGWVHAAPLTSPVFTGNPTAPTPTAGDNDTSIATTAFVTAAVSGGGNFIQAGTGAVTRTMQNKVRERISAADFGVVADGVTDNTAAYAAAIAAFPATGGVLFMPAGICMGVMNVTKPIIVQGVGMGYVGAATGVAATEMRSGGAADNILTFSANGGGARDLCVTSSVAAASRTGAGLRIGYIQGIEIRNVVSNGHKFGFWNCAPGNTFSQCYANSNNMYGLYLDGTAFPQSEIGISSCQFNSNVNGVGIGGTGIGIFATRLTSANNTGVGVYFEPGSTIDDVYFIQPEISGNLLHGVDAINNTGLNLEFDSGGVIEVLGGTGNAVRAGVNQKGVRIRNTYLTSGNNVVAIGIQGDNTTISGNTIYSFGDSTFALHIFGTANDFNIYGNDFTASGSSQTAMLIDSGATLGRISGNILSGYTSNVINTANTASIVIANNSSTVGSQETQSGVTPATTTTGAFGPLFTGSVAVTFAKPFTTIPKVVVAPFSGGGGGAVSAYAESVTTTGFLVRGVGVTNGGSFACHYVASVTAF